MIAKHEVEGGVSEARALLREGHRLRAAFKLQEVVEKTSDPSVLHEIERIGEAGIEGASVIERPSWMKVLGEAERRERDAHVAPGLRPGVVEITPAQARTLAGLAETEGPLVLHQLGYAGTGPAPEAVHAAPRDSEHSYRIAHDGTRTRVETRTAAA